MDLPGIPSSSFCISVPTTISEDTFLIKHDNHLVKDRPLDARAMIGPVEAAIRIQRFWRCHHNRKIFKLLKHAARAAETSAAHGILKKVSPSEAELLRDAGMQFKVRFRFAGCEFPPFIVFKIFHCTGGYGNQYLSGKRIINASSEAAENACRLMGHRAYCEQMICDDLEYQQHRITDMVDVATLKDYMQAGKCQKERSYGLCANNTQLLTEYLEDWKSAVMKTPVRYLSHLDETPAHMGGRDNCWRRLSLKNMPRTTIMYDIVDYAESGTLSDRLKQEIKLLLQVPHNEDIQRQQLSAITQTRSPVPPPSSVISTHWSSLQTEALKHSSRRSHRARSKVAKMRRIYGLEREEREQQDTTSYTTDISNMQFSHGKENLDQIIFSDEDWDDEAQKLYAWSQGLSIDDT